MNKQAVIVLHEIYGINEFIENTCRKFENAGFDVFCPNMNGRTPFSYDEAQKAYDHFIENVGFNFYKQVSAFVIQLKGKYEKVFIVGYSSGATVAWRCCENSLCDGIIACYGSRIRDYTDLTPSCPTLLLFAKKDSFNVDSLIDKLKGKPHMMIVKYDASHGFMDVFSKYYDIKASKYAEESIFHFLSEYGS